MSLYKLCALRTAKCREEVPPTLIQSTPERAGMSQSKMISVLLVEDDSALAGSLADYLSEVGFEVDFAFNGAAGVDLARKQAHDVIVMDIGMPGLDGLAACRALRQSHHLGTPILFLTARDTLSDKLEGFDAGADDYLVKPIAPAELASRLKAIVRRASSSGAEVQQLGDLLIDHKLRHVSREGVRIELPEIPYQLLSLLARAAPGPVSRSKLEEEVWVDGPPGSDPLRTHIYRLRQMLDAPFGKPLVRTVHGKGYRLAIPD
jgi:DNA-binding response OmpR family regulator